MNNLGEPFRESEMAFPLIELSAVRLTPAGDSVEIRFRNLGPWRTFKIARARRCADPFEGVEGVSPIVLGAGDSRFVCPLNGSSSGRFHVRGE